MSRLSKKKLFLSLLSLHLLDLGQRPLVPTPPRHRPRGPQKGPPEEEGQDQESRETDAAPLRGSRDGAQSRRRS